MSTWTRAREVSLTPHDYITNVKKRLGVASADAAFASWIHSWNTQKPAAPPKPHEDTTHVFTPSWVD